MPSDSCVLAGVEQHVEPRERGRSARATLLRARRGRQRLFLIGPSLIHLHRRHRLQLSSDRLDLLAPNGAREYRAKGAQHFFATRVRSVNHAERMAHSPACPSRSRYSLAAGKRVNDDIERSNLAVAATGMILWKPYIH
jgi:hypothetical protein